MQRSPDGQAKQKEHSGIQPILPAHIAAHGQACAGRMGHETQQDNQACHAAGTLQDPPWERSGVEAMQVLHEPTGAGPADSLHA